MAAHLADLDAAEIARRGRHRWKAAGNPQSECARLKGAGSVVVPTKSPKAVVALDRM